MKSIESPPSLPSIHYRVIFVVAIGIPIFLIAWILDPSYSVPPINGWGLVCFYLAMGFLSVGLFGLLCLLSHYAFRIPNFAKEWQLGFASLFVAGITFVLFLTILDTSGVDFFRR